jgi:hypothetical protein
LQGLGGVVPGNQINNEESRRKEKQVERVWGILYVCGHACSRQKWETLFGSLIHETRKNIK